ncbi:ComEA family DNA-binding protein [Lunatimonas salinarum]|uniref:ComEA family DNA-binding protein n=1 Tax=Lunatimonas salinarum TaxID=1774590 RepID=UPI001ADFC929|nr:helix-hairpin-helix domain-containing protein [Lunatimonas salinarum]
MKRAVFRFLRMYFGFSRRESRGFFLVFPVLVTLYFVPGILAKIFQHAEKNRYASYVAEAQAIADRLEQDSEAIAVIGEFATREAVNTSFSQDTSKTTKRQFTKPPAPALNVVAFHQADSILLQAVSGVGPVISSRIIKYRDRLGGFYDAGQLLEVYGVTEELAVKIYEMFPFTPLVREKLAMNELTARELARHPYIGNSEAKVIYAYRNQHGPFSRPEDLLNIKIFTEEWVNRLIPYMAF